MKGNFVYCDTNSSNTLGEFEIGRARRSSSYSSPFTFKQTFQGCGTSSSKASVQAKRVRAIRERLY